MTEDERAEAASEKLALEQAVRDIAQAVIADADLAVQICESPRMGTAIQELTDSMTDLGLGSPGYL